MTWKDDFKAHAAACAPREACGLLVRTAEGEVYFPCTNASTQVGVDHFVIPSEDYIAAEAKGAVIAVCHSHPNGPLGPSIGDMNAIEASKMPWWILFGEEMSLTYPTGWKAPYVGRRFFVGTMDCYTLVRDWYAGEMGILLPDVFRTDGWEAAGQNFYLDNFEKFGFERIDPRDLKRGDGILMQIGASVPNHAGIYVGNDRILHHLRGRTSGEEAYGGYYRKMTTHCLRYRGTC